MVTRADKRKEINTYRTSEVINKLPGSCRPQVKTPADLIGAKILSFGGFDDPSVSSGFGGLVVDYESGGARRRLVLGFDDMAMWVVARIPEEQNELPAASQASLAAVPESA